MGALASALEAKYGGATSEGVDGVEEPSEEDFLAAAARVKNKKQRGSAPGNKENGREKKKRKSAKQ